MKKFVLQQRKRGGAPYVDRTMEQLWDACLMWIDGSDMSTMYQDQGSTPVTADGQDVARIYEKADNGVSFDFVFNSTTPPVYKENVKNSRSALLYGGDGDFLRAFVSSPSSMPQPYTLFVVGKISDGLENNNDGMYFTQCSNLGGVELGKHGGYVPDNWYLHLSSSDTGGAADDDWNIWAVQANGANTFARKNGVELMGGSLGTGGFHSQYYLGLNLDGYIAEFLLFLEELTEGEIENVEAYLSTRWDITVT